MTGMERRKRIYEICEQNGDYKAWKAQYDEAHRRWESFTNILPYKIRVFLWDLPACGYFLHHRMLNVVCETMRFPEEQEDPK